MLSLANDRPRLRMDAGRWRCWTDRRPDMPSAIAFGDTKEAAYARWKELIDAALRYFP